MTYERVVHMNKDTIEKLKEESVFVYYLFENPLGCLFLIVYNVVLLVGSYFLIKVTLDLVIG